MDSEALVQLALDALSCSQKELAAHLNVSPSQISKWKKGEHMSHEMEEKLRAIANIGDKDPSFVLSAGSLEDAIKWERLIHYLAETADEDAETGYQAYPLLDELGLLCGETFDVLKEMGVALPKEFPKELDMDYGETDSEELWESIYRNPYSAFIYKIYKSLNDVYGFYAAYVNELIDDDDLNLMDTAAHNIEPCLLSLAACKVEASQEFAPKLNGFRHKVTKDYEDWLTIVKDRAFRAGAPLRAELLGLVYDSDDELGHEAEAESLGFNASRIHPDIYMNELLVGMRIIHQALPTIMKKLGIYEQFKLDTSKLRIG
jgi:transcriptional regulator with XRE-family HTH domain